MHLFRIKNRARVCCVDVSAHFTSLYLVCLFMYTLHIFLLLTHSMPIQIYVEHIKLRLVFAKTDRTNNSVRDYNKGITNYVIFIFLQLLI
jgi:hypothetical protein